MTHEEIMQMADVYRDIGHVLGHGADARATLAFALAEVCRDAERYRWLRVSDPSRSDVFDHYCEVDLDDAIDAAMGKK